MTKDLDDKICINNLKKGDVKSFDDIFKKYNKKVYCFALSYLRNREEAQDVVQEVFMNLWRHREQINEYYVFSKYLYKITFNSTCKRFRKLASDRKQMEEVVRTSTQEDNSTSLEIEYNDLVKTTNEFINKMPARQKIIYLLKVNDQLTTEQIAHQLNLSKKTVENYLSGIKTSLKKSFSGGGILSVLFFCLFFNI
jgi:RNA polymerase sigma-70 factor (ECF subfamily)